MYKKGHVHFVGIGGIGMSGIAKILKYQGYTISGCDNDLEQKSVEDLLKIGCSVYKGNNTENCKNNSVDILVYSSAIKSENPEIRWAQDRGIPTIPRALMLAELMRTKYSIAITGSHGKTTTTSIISHILIEAHKDPTVIIGGHLHSISANARLGNGDFLVAEADESDRSFLRLYPTLAVVTNIDLEHLETYKDLADIKTTFKNFLENIPFYGKAIICTDDPNVRSILPLTTVKTLKYGLESHGDIKPEIYATDIILSPDSSEFNIWSNQTNLGRVTLNMPGKHNILNSLAATAICLDVGVNFETVSKALSDFKGVDRRFTFKGNYKNAEFFDDYGHHPTEIFHTLLVARKRSKGKLIVVFQPHRYIRTHRLWQDFINTFANSAVDKLIITDIYSAGEAPIDGITGENLAREINNNQTKFKTYYAGFNADFNNIKNILESEISENDLVLTLGAGKVNKLFSVITGAK